MNTTTKPGAVQAGARKFEVDDSLENVFDFFDDACAKGWTDGLPVYPPTDRAVNAMLRYTDRDRHEVVAKIPPRDGAATVEKMIAVLFMVFLTNRGRACRDPRAGPRSPRATR